MANFSINIIFLDFTNSFEISYAQNLLILYRLRAMYPATALKINRLR